jgi:putative phage-type endonuclease
MWLPKIVTPGSPRTRSFFVQKLALCQTRRVGCVNADGQSMSGLSPEQLAERALGITATDIGAIVGVNPWRGPMDVWLDKREERPNSHNDSVRSVWGQKLEPIIRDDYEERHGVRVEVPGTLSHAAHGWHKATPDGIVYRRGYAAPDRGLEIKVHGREVMLSGRLEYGAPGTDEVPAHELVQCAWNMHVRDLDRWDLVAFIDGAPIEYAIERDDELIGMLVDAADRFYTDHILTGEPPAPDGGEAWEGYLKRRWTGANKPELIAVDNDQAVQLLLHDLRNARAKLAEFEELKDSYTQQLKRIIGDAAGLSWSVPGRKKPDAVTWKRNRSSKVTDWIAVMSDMRQAAALVASGRSKEIHQAIVWLTGQTGSQPHGAYLVQLAHLIAAMRDTLTDIAKASTEATHTKTVDGARPFLVPRSWTQLKSDNPNPEI